MTKIIWHNRNDHLDLEDDVNMASKPKQVMSHNEFLKRIRKSLYYGGTTSMSKCQTITRPLADYAAELYSETHTGYSLNRLNTVTIGNLKATPCSFILAMIYLDRLMDTDPLYAKKITPSELFIVSLMVSTKFYSGYDETDIYMSEWAEYGDMTVAQLKQIEIEFLCAIDWRVFVSNEEFCRKLLTVETVVAERQGMSRGWFTYTELNLLLPTISIAKHLLQYSTIFAISYVASCVTLIGAFFLASNVPGSALYKPKPTTTPSINQSNTTFNDTDTGCLSTDNETDLSSNDLTGDGIDNLQQQLIQREKYTKLLNRLERKFKTDYLNKRLPLEIPWTNGDFINRSTGRKSKHYLPNIVSIIKSINDSDRYLLPIRKDLFSNCNYFNLYYLTKCS